MELNYFRLTEDNMPYESLMMYLNFSEDETCFKFD